MHESDQTATPEVCQHAYDLVRDLIPVIHRFPRDFRFTLGERLERSVLDLMLCLRDARFPHRRGAALAGADKHLDRARVLCRLACDLRAMSTGAYGRAAEALALIGRQVGGWRKLASSGR